MIDSFVTSTPSRLAPPTVPPHISDLSWLVADRYWDPHERAVLGPRTVVVLHARLVEDLVQHEPGVRAALPDPAVRDGVLGSERDARVGVQLAKLVVGAERAVVVGRLAPRDVDRARDVTAALGLLLGEVCRGQQPTGVLIG